MRGAHPRGGADGHPWGGRGGRHLGGRGAARHAARDRRRPVPGPRGRLARLGDRRAPVPGAPARRGARLRLADRLDGHDPAGLPRPAPGGRAGQHRAGTRRRRARRRRPARGAGRVVAHLRVPARGRPDRRRSDASCAGRTASPPPRSTSSPPGSSPAPADRGHRRARGRHQARWRAGSGPRWARPRDAPPRHRRRASTTPRCGPRCDAMATGAAVVVPGDGSLRGLVHAGRSGIRDDPGPDRGRDGASATCSGTRVGATGSARPRVPAWPGGTPGRTWRAASSTWPRGGRGGGGAGRVGDPRRSPASAAAAVARCCGPVEDG